MRLTSFELRALVGFVLIPLVLIVASVQQGGSGQPTPRDTREWIKRCAQDPDAYCKALRSTVARGVGGPVVVLDPAARGGETRTATLTRWKGQPVTMEELEALARANTFTIPDLHTGVIQSLDGQRHAVTCDGAGTCRIGSLSVRRSVRFPHPDAGAVYVPVPTAGQRPVLLPP